MKTVMYSLVSTCMYAGMYVHTFTAESIPLVAHVAGAVIAAYGIDAGSMLMAHVSSLEAFVHVYSVMFASKQ